MRTAHLTCLPLFAFVCVALVIVIGVGRKSMMEQQELLSWMSSLTQKQKFSVASAERLNSTFRPLLHGSLAVQNGTLRSKDKPHASKQRVGCRSVAVCSVGNRHWGLMHVLPSFAYINGGDFDYFVVSGANSTLGMMSDAVLKSAVQRVMRGRHNHCSLMFANMSPLMLLSNTRKVML
jgi:hypothetical protein